jgi:hypothetical protein
LQTGGDDILDRSIRNSQNLYSTNYDSLRDRLKRECRGEGLLFTGGCVRQKLEGAHVSEVQQLEGARDQAIEVARAAAERRLERPVTINTNLEYDRLRSYQDWFEELEDQQYCNQRPDDPRCLELGQFRHNGVFYVKNRSLSKMEEMCQPQRTTLGQIEQAQERARAIDREPASMAGANFSVASGTAQMPRDIVFEQSEQPGFFNRLFQGVSNFFRSIGEFIGLVSPRQPVGEQQRPLSPMPTTETYISYDQPDIMDSPRASSEVFEGIDDNTFEPVLAQPEIDNVQYDRIPSSLNTLMTQALEHPVFEDEVVGEQFLLDLGEVSTLYPQEVATIDHVLQQLIAEKELDETPISDGYEMILDRPRLNAHQKAALLYELAWTEGDGFEQAVRMMDRTQIEIHLTLEHLDTELQALIEATDHITLNDETIVFDMRSLSNANQSMSLYQKMIELYRENSMARRSLLLREIIQLL